MNIQSVSNIASGQSSPPISVASNREGSAAADAVRVASSAGTTALPSKATEQVSAEQLKEATDRIKAFVQPINSGLEFAIDKDSGRTLVKVIDQQTKEVVRQIPSEEVLNIAKALDKLQGLFIQNKA